MEGRVIFRLQPVGLSATGYEGIQHRDLRRRLKTPGRLVFFAEKNAEFIDRFRGECRVLRVCKRVLTVPEIRSRLAQRDAADSPGFFGTGPEPRIAGSLYSFARTGAKYARTSPYRAADSQCCRE